MRLGAASLPADVLWGSFVKWMRDKFRTIGLKLVKAKLVILAKNVSIKKEL